MQGLLGYLVIGSIVSSKWGCLLLDLLVPYILELHYCVRAWVHRRIHWYSGGPVGLWWHVGKRWRFTFKYYYMIQVDKQNCWTCYFLLLLTKSTQTNIIISPTPRYIALTRVQKAEIWGPKSSQSLGCFSYPCAVGGPYHHWWFAFPD